MAQATRGHSRRRGANSTRTGSSRSRATARSARTSWAATAGRGGDRPLPCTRRADHHHSNTGGGGSVTYLVQLVLLAWTKRAARSSNWPAGVRPCRADGAVAQRGDDHAVGRDRHAQGGVRHLLRVHLPAGGVIQAQVRVGAQDEAVVSRQHGDAAGESPPHRAAGPRCPGGGNWCRASPPVAGAGRSSAPAGRSRRRAPAPAARRCRRRRGPARRPRSGSGPAWRQPDGQRDPGAAEVRRPGPRRLRQPPVRREPAPARVEGPEDEAARRERHHLRDQVARRRDVRRRAEAEIGPAPDHVPPVRAPP